MSLVKILRYNFVLFIACTCVPRWVPVICVLLCLVELCPFCFVAHLCVRPHQSAESNLFARKIGDLFESKESSCEFSREKYGKHIQTDSFM